MRDDILLNLDNPQQLEQLYQANKSGFKAAFDALYPQLHNNMLAEGWYQRLHYDVPGRAFWGTDRERVVVLVACLLAAFLAKLPMLLSLNQDQYYLRNVGFIVFPLLIGYFGWKRTISRKTGAVLAGLILLATIYVNLLPQRPASDTLLLACLHVPLWLWSLLGFTFEGGHLRSKTNWLDFLRYNGELGVMSALLLIAGGLTTGLTINLFRIIGQDITNFFVDYVVVCGLAMVPIVATFLTQNQPALVGKVSPVIAGLFSPIALVMLIVYLVAIVVSGKDPYHDREFLLIFNALLIGVMALIFFSVAESSATGPTRSRLLILLLLSVVTVLVNGVALSAILFRISEWGFTPNRTAILGANLLMLSHLLLIGVRLWQALTRRADLSRISQSMTVFLPIYSLWSAIVVFAFPVLFGFA